MIDLNKPRLTIRNYCDCDTCKLNDDCGNDYCKRRAEIYTRLQELENAIEDGELVSVVHGEWVLITAPKKYAGGIVCSNCKKSTDWQYNYCPNCGAKMDLEGER